MTNMWMQVGWETLSLTRQLLPRDNSTHCGRGNMIIWWTTSQHHHTYHLLPLLPPPTLPSHPNLLIAPWPLQAHFCLMPFPGFIFPQMSTCSLSDPSFWSGCPRLPLIKSILCSRYLKFLSSFIKKINLWILKAILWGERLIILIPEKLTDVPQLIQLVGVGVRI